MVPGIWGVGNWDGMVVTNAAGIIGLKWQRIYMGKMPMPRLVMNLHGQDAHATWLVCDHERGLMFYHLLLHDVSRFD
jgi:hypothetical protein